MNSNESGQKKSKSQSLNPTHEARPVWLNGRHRILLAPITTWWVIDTRVACANWCEDNEQALN